MTKLYLLLVDGEETGTPMWEDELDTLIWKSQPAVINKLEKRPYVPEFVVINGRV